MFLKRISITMAKPTEIMDEQPDEFVSVIEH